MGNNLKQKLDTPVQYIKGVGPRLSSVFNEKGIFTVKDLFFFFPRYYEDRSRATKVENIHAGEKTTIKLTVVSQNKIPLKNKPGSSLLVVNCMDSEGKKICLKWFRIPFGIDKKLNYGVNVVATGKVTSFRGTLEIAHPELTIGVSGDNGELDRLVSNEEKEELNFGRIVPVYTEISGVSNKVLRRIIWNAVSEYSQYAIEDIPNEIIQKHKLPTLGESIKNIHFPNDDFLSEEFASFRSRYHKRMIYDEFFKFEIIMLKRKELLSKEKTQNISKESLKTVEEHKIMLPFTLTSEQELALADILSDMLSSKAMNRLVQGDVGSGKTAVAFLAASSCLSSGFQATLIAPTEILAEQHYKNALNFFKGRLNCALLTAHTKKEKRAELITRLNDGEPVLVIGTHAILEKDIVFKNLRLNIVDEQHRFGVEQRTILRQKSTLDGSYISPHTLLLSATPIPRTLALTAYGDLSISTIKELPPGRHPVETVVLKGQGGLKTAYEKISQEVKEGRQAYIIYPLINESEAQGFTSLKSVIKESERLKTKVFSDLKVGLLHGQMSQKEKDEVITQFKNNEINILVSTTVVEVGIDVPNASVLLLEHPERFGLSQIHQLRGRVGRGEHKSYCFLCASQREHTEATKYRLEVLEETQDGFKIAEADLALRGPGEFIGVRQSGNIVFGVADLVRDKELLEAARFDATDCLSKDFLEINEFFLREGNSKIEQMKSS